MKAFILLVAVTLLARPCASAPETINVPASACERYRSACA